MKPFALENPKKLKNLSIYRIILSSKKCSWLMLPNTGTFEPLHLFIVNI